MGQDRYPATTIASSCTKCWRPGYDFVDLMASLENMDGDLSIRTYHFERAEQETDMAWLLEKETDFYQNNVLNGVPPAAILRL